MKTLLTKYPVIVIVLLCIVTRLPQLLSPYLFLDEDECVTGVMAKYLMAGKDFSLFFWGQRYGFTFLESCAIVPFYLILGIGTLAVKLGILFLWTIGVIFLYKIILLLNKNNQLQALLLITLFICLPAWAVWAMKARGGYITAFTLSNLCILLLLHPATKDKIGYSILNGLLIVLIYESQMLWLTGVLPLFAFQLLSEKKWKQTIITLLVSIVCLGCFWYYQQGITISYNPVFKLPPIEQVGPRIARFPEYLYNSLHGQYFFDVYESPFVPGAIMAVACSIILYLLTLKGIVHLLFKRKGYGLFIMSSCFVILIFIFNLTSIKEEGRYLLPVSAFALIAVCIYLKDKQLNKPIRFTIIGFIVTGFISMISFYNFQFQQGKKGQVIKLIQFLKSHQYKYCYSTDCMLPWHIIFYSNEDIVSRMPFYPGRHVTYDDKIDQTFLSGNTKEIAVVGNTGHYLGLHLPDTSFVDLSFKDNSFFISSVPSKTELFKTFAQKGGKFPENLRH
jgi:hypothetical protein